MEMDVSEAKVESSNGTVFEDSKFLDKSGIDVCAMTTTLSSILNGKNDAISSEMDVSLSATLTEKERILFWNNSASNARNGNDEINVSSTNNVSSSDKTIISDSKINENPDMEKSNSNEDATIMEHTVHDDEEPEAPLIQSKYFQKPLIELGRRLWPSREEKQQYTKGCLWSPDGTCILLPVHMDGMHVIELPSDLYAVNNVSKERNVSQLGSAVHVKEGGTVYDFAWYPFMNSQSPDSCCWIATRQHEPIHMWDAFTGELRCSYRGYNQVDEVEAAISVAFSNDGEKILGGYKKSIKIFDTNKPGRDCSAIPVKKAVSCFALPGTNDSTVTCGSWNGYIDHYDLRSPQLGSLFTLGGHKGGITWLKYTKMEPLMLISGARKDNQLLMWDMRNYEKPLMTFSRNVSTNQRIYFDLSPQQQYLASGDCDGSIHIWDFLNDFKEYRVNIHNDCCNAVNFHPTLPILATSSGQYQFCNKTTGEHDNHDDDDEEGSKTQQNTIIYENSLVLSWFGE